MDLYKFGIKLFFTDGTDYFSQKIIPVFHKWIQDKTIPNHLLIDVADYSHIADGPGVMLIAHEGHFSLHQECKKPGMMYMRKTSTKGDFAERFHTVFATAQHAAKLLESSTDHILDFSQKSFRFIANDRRLAANTNENRELYQDEIAMILEKKFSGNSWNYSEISNEDERLAFTVDFTSDIR